MDDNLATVRVGFVKGEGDDGEQLLDMYFQSPPSFKEGEIVGLVSKVNNDKWNPDVALEYGEYKVLSVKQSFEKGYSVTVHQTLHMTVHVEKVKEEENE